MTLSNKVQQIVLSPPTDRKYENSTGCVFDKKRPKCVRRV